MGASAITIKQNRSFNLNLVFTTALGNPFPLTNFILAMMIKPSIPAPDNTAIYSSESPTGAYIFGNVTFSIAPSVTGTFPVGTYDYEIAVRSLDGTISSNIIQDTCTVSATVRNSF